MEVENFFEKFTPDHSLILKKEHEYHDYGDPPNCHVCGKKITWYPFYSCDEDCNVVRYHIFIHKSCTELPRNIQHHLHPDHTLFLTSPSDRYGNYICNDFKCNACGREWEGFFYHCDLCDFNLDLKCVSITVNSIEHPSHKHPLKTPYRIILCLCDACGTKHEGLFYECSTCNQFRIHEGCASLPTTYEDTDYHDHPLTLAYSLPSEYTTFGVYCQICEKGVGRVWVYHCGRCRFVYHINCVTPQTEHFLSVLLPNKECSSRDSDLGDSDLDVVHLPLQDDNLSVADHLSIGIQMRATEKTTYSPNYEGIRVRATQKTCSSKYCQGQPLILSFDDVQGSDTRLDTLHDHEKYQNKLCNACIRPVTTTPFYKCVDECNYILHESCAQLPFEIQHPFHPEHLLVLKTTSDFCYFFCRGCDFRCSGFRYYCWECEYVLDVICASLPTTIKYKAQGNHTMYLKEKISRRCTACYFDRSKSTFAYSCGNCNFELHAVCATYPSRIRHRNDEAHPYSLTYRHVEGRDSDYLCDVCETQIDPGLWFYHCVECDKSIHVDCHPTYDSRSRIKFGGVITIDSHEHPLIMVPVIPVNTQCNGYVRVITEGTTCSHDCGIAFDVKESDHPMGFKCLECNYNIHYSCLAKLTPLESSSDASTFIRPFVYLTPRLWYLRLNVFERQDLVPTNKTRFRNAYIQARIGNQVMRTRTVHRQLNPLWNEDLLFVVAEPFEDHLILIAKDCVGPGQDEIIGRVIIPLNTVEKQVDDRIINSRWFNLEKPMFVDPKREQFSSKIHLRICLDGRYHVPDESIHYRSDLRPTVKQLWKPSIGVLELGILKVVGFHHMKTRDGKGTSDMYCVAKYGHKWIRTRTIVDNLFPIYNEKYTWEVYDPSTFLTIGVFDNSQLAPEKGSPGHNDLKIGKVRIRISTLEMNRVYTHSHPLLVLHPKGVKKMGEIHLTIRFSCTSVADMMYVYSKPLLPKMHYVCPSRVMQLDELRHQAVNIVAAQLGRGEPPLRKEVVEYMSDVDSHLWSMRRSKANFFRLMAVFNGVFAVGKWFGDVCMWRNPITTVLVHILYILPVCFPKIILPTGFLYMFLIGIWNYRYRPRYLTHMDIRISQAEAVHPDELDEEFDMFPTTRNPDTVRFRYDRLRSITGRIQTVVGDIATQGERIHLLLSWRDPRATAIFVMFCLVAAVVLCVTPFQVIAALAGVYLMRHPRFRNQPRQQLLSVPINFFERLPTKTDSLL